MRHSNSHNRTFKFKLLNACQETTAHHKPASKCELRKERLRGAAGSPPFTAFSRWAASYSVFKVLRRRRRRSRRLLLGEARRPVWPGTLLRARAAHPAGPGGTAGASQPCREGAGGWSRRTQTGPAGCRWAQPARISRSGLMA
jgi:hypothetical protein